MESYLLLKWLHVLAACLYVGGSFANGLLKTLADRASSAEASAALLTGVVWSNRVLLVAPSGMLFATGLMLARLGRLPLASGWVAHGIALFAMLSPLLVWGMRIEHRLAALAAEPRRSARRFRPRIAASRRSTPDSVSPRRSRCLPRSS